MVSQIRIEQRRRRTIFLTLVCTIGLVGCSAMSLRTNAHLTLTPPNSPERQFSYEAVGAHELPGWSAACWVTGIFYGGACWGYLSLPDDEMMGVERERLMAFVASIGPCAAASNVRITHYEWNTTRRGPDVVDDRTGARTTLKELAGVCGGAPASAGAEPVQSLAPAKMEPAAPAVVPPAPRVAPAPFRRRGMDLSSAPVVAVFQIEDGGARRERKVMGQLTEYLAAQLTASGLYRVIPPSRLRAQIAETQAKSYRQCYDQACQIELGKALAAEKTIATKLLRIGNVCALTSTLFDLRTEAPDAAASTRTDCKEASLMDGIDRIVRQLVDASRTK